MRLSILPSLVALALLVACQEEESFNKTMPVQVNASGHASAHNPNFNTHLDGEQEEPEPVDTQAQGQAKFQLSRDGDELSYKLIVANIENVRMAHLHLITEPDAVTGGVVVWLYPDGPPPQTIPGRTDGVLAEGVITSADLVGALAGMDLSALIEAMEAGKVYVNVHTDQYPSGEIRGDI